MLEYYMKHNRKNVDYIIVDEVDLFLNRNPIAFNQAIGDSFMIGLTGTAPDPNDRSEIASTLHRAL